MVVTLASKEDKLNILRVNANLIRNHRYKRVIIHPDMSKRERQLQILEKLLTCFKTVM